MTPLERAARALCTARDIDPYATSWWHKSEQQENNLDIARDEVRAVLTAIREPSEAVITAMRDTLPAVYPAEFREAINVGGEDIENAPKQHWQAMIDAMLEEG